MNRVDTRRYIEPCANDDNASFVHSLKILELANRYTGLFLSVCTVRTVATFPVFYSREFVNRTACYSKNAGHSGSLLWKKFFEHVGEIRRFMEK